MDAEGMDPLVGNQQHTDLVWFKNSSLIGSGGTGAEKLTSSQNPCLVSSAGK